MSFSHNAKDELCKIPVASDCCAVAESLGILLYCNTFSQREVRVVTESPALAKRLPRLFQRAFGVTFDSAQVGSAKTTFLITERAKLETIFGACGFAGSNMIAHHINLGVLEEDCCRRSFARGAFLAGGAVTDPAKSYHLELVTDHFSVSRELLSLLGEMGFSPKEASRGGHYIAYFKQSAAIEDFLTTLGAPVSAMTLMAAKVEKDLRNSVQRRVNCDTGNVSKLVDAAQSHIDAIERLGAELDKLPQKLRDTAMLRVDNPESSLAELAELHSPPITKSCLNHRLRKLVELAQR
ncbi:MAG: DNA-binding protein WhiA [Oscillospiraceae bacterium]|jgi:DNA-binding protein WhiA|nr:DNA-binding protein WhiA [Oscillospiraceae bacterium]